METSVLHTEDIEDLEKFGYVIEKKIGQGSFSKVYRASFDPTLLLDQSEGSPEPLPSSRTSKRVPSQRLACKVVEKSYKMPKDYPHKFLQRELNIMTKLQHPHIVRLHSILRKGPKFMIFMRSYVSRGTLCDHILLNGPLTENIAKRWFRQLILAIIYLHTMNIAHRDISCDNILLTHGYNVKICDFGYSCFSVTVAGWPRYFDTHCGSLPYVAPEIIRGLPYNPKYSDVWSLGIVLFVMLNGTFPFIANSYERQYADQTERNYAFKKNIERGTTIDGIRKVDELLDPNPLLRISLQEVIESDWMSDANAEVPAETKKSEVCAQKSAENIKEGNELIRGKNKKYSIQYPWIKIEKETYFERLDNLTKRHVMKGKTSASFSLSHRSTTTENSTSYSPASSSSPKQRSKQVSFWQSDGILDRSSSSISLRHHSILFKKQSRVSPDRRSTCSVM